MPVSIAPITWPTILVEIDVAHDPNDPAAPAQTWLDITRYVAGQPGEGRIEIERGRDYELETISPGTATVSLDNRDGRFDPSNTSGPYFPDLLPMRQIRVSATYNSVHYPLFTGYVERWPQSWADSGLRGRADATAVDALASLARTDLLAPWVGTARASGATRLYPLTEPVGATTVADIVGGKSGRLQAKNGGTVTLGGTPPVADLGAASFSPDGHVYFIDPLVTSAQFSVEVIFAVSFGGSYYAAWPITQGRDGAPGGAGLYFLLFVTLTGDVGFTVGDGTNESNAQSSTNPYTPTRWAHLIGTVDSDLKTTHVYLNGVDVTSSSTPAASALSSVVKADTRTKLGVDTSQVSGSGMTGVLGGVAVYNGITLTPAQVADLYSAYTSFIGDTPGERIGHLATIAGWTGATSLPAGQSVMPVAEIAGEKALAPLQEAARADGGTVFAAGSGALTFLPRTAFYNPTSLYTFGEDVAGGEIPYNDIAFDFDVDKVVNDWQVSRPGGGTSGATDAASQQRYFVSSQDETLEVDSDDQTQAAAEHWLALYKDPAMRVESVTIRPSQFSGSLANLAWTACLGLEIGNCVTVARRPPGISEISAACIVQKIQHSAVDGEWETTFGLTPADLTAYARWDVDQFDQEAWAW